MPDPEGRDRTACSRGPSAAALASGSVRQAWSERTSGRITPNSSLAGARAAPVCGGGRNCPSAPGRKPGLSWNWGLPNCIGSVPTTLSPTIAFSMKRFPSSRGSLQRCGQVEWHPAQFSANSPFPVAALARSMRPRTSSGHCGGASLRSSSSSSIWPLKSMVDFEQALGARRRTEVSFHKHADRFAAVAQHRVGKRAAPLRPGRLRDVPDKGVFHRRHGGPPILRNAELRRHHLVMDQRQRVDPARAGRGRRQRSPRAVGMDGIRVVEQLPPQAVRPAASWAPIRVAMRSNLAGSNSVACKAPSKPSRNA